GPSTRFSQNTDVRIEDAIPDAYMPFAQPILAAFANPGEVTTAADVAGKVWEAANDTSDQLHYPAGPDAIALAKL
ncbi:MAG: short-chain dehydrogenase/reductase, partial [Sphingomicrobium sp.]